MSDLVVLTDENDNELGLVERAKAHQEGLWHRIAVVYLTRPDGTVAVQKRTSGRFDHSAAGHVDPGETYLQTARRELQEELGVSGVELKEVGTTKSNAVEQEKGIEHMAHIYRVFTCEAEPKKLDPNEVDSITWQKPQSILADMASDPKHEKYCAGFKATLKLFVQSQ